jgi:hypothetical protein
VFGITPEAFDAVNVVVISTHQSFGVIGFEVLAELVQGIKTLEGVGVIHRTFPGFGLDNL